MFDSDTLMVLTYKSVERLLSEGGTSSWRLNRSEVLKREFALCTRNRFDERCEGTEPHGSAFLVGRIKDAVPAPGRDKRWLLTFSEYALIAKPNAWAGDRNPVRYTSLEQLGISLDDLDFQPMPAPATLNTINPDAHTTAAKDTKLLGALSIAEAKAGLSITFGVSPDNIEIVLRA